MFANIYRRLVGLLWLMPFLLSLASTLEGPELREGFFNGSAEVRLHSPLDLRGHTGLSFRTCRGGELFYKESNGNSISLRVVENEGLLFRVRMENGRLYEARLSARLLDNLWHPVNLLYRAGNLSLAVAGHHTIVANSTHNPDLLNNPGLFNDTSILYVGRGFHGCILRGPSIVFNRSPVAVNVAWGPCPLNSRDCTMSDHCSTQPCMQHGECVSRADRYECICYPPYSGNNCEIGHGPVCYPNDTVSCLNGGTCIEDKGNYRCVCDPEHTGQVCESDIISFMCSTNPCANNGSCHMENDHQKCICLPGFTGDYCNINIDECQSSPCQNGGTCEDGINNYTCICGDLGYKGHNCDENIDECSPVNPCINGICFDNYGSYTCQCNVGFGGQNCEMKITECSSAPCQHGGICVNIPGSYHCQCTAGYTGRNCDVAAVTSCEELACTQRNADCIVYQDTYQCRCRLGFEGPNCTEISTCTTTPCRNGGICKLTGSNQYACLCPPGFTGMYCEQPISWCTSMPCVNGGTCIEDDCLCPVGFMGSTCSMHATPCSNNPCLHAISCTDYDNNNYMCICKPGWTGRNCDEEIPNCIEGVHDQYCDCGPGKQCNVDECLSNPCRNGGMCSPQSGGGGFVCNCTEDYVGAVCEERDPCLSSPCLNNGTCLSRYRRMGTGMGFTCDCPQGFSGPRCSVDMVDCRHRNCPENMECTENENGAECQCREGFSGENCSISLNDCRSMPCNNGGSCINISTGHNTCVCPPEYTGPRCNELSMVECRENSPTCLFGICKKSPGNDQCYCQPGYSGIHCDIDFDECLSKPCHHGAKCENKINDFSCLCPPGYTGKDCSFDVDECKSNPCSSGSTCHNGIGHYTCTCPPGLTGIRCDIDINDCISVPCLNNGTCQDLVNNYHCDCSDTGFSGDRCQNNVDDCNPNPCEHATECKDLVNSYECVCFPGYEGKSCNEDIDECLSTPCQFGGTCLENSKPESYENPDYPFYNQTMDPTRASGYKCLCEPGVTGDNCETNINECDSNPCANGGTCVDNLNYYTCECSPGFEGENCRVDIDECEKHHPCVEGRCVDHRADYSCLCDPNYGGKNCSVELIGCTNDSCHNNGTCTPYLENETNHKFNCSCHKGFHGDRCEMVTTMSLTEKSKVQIVTRREEGYDLRFRFKTTLPNCLLAIGKGLTYYSLALRDGRLTLFSSLLNKWEGISIGTDLANGTMWQKMFVQINSSHVVLAANEEQTIHPINLNESTNISFTSFQITYLGTAIPELRSLGYGQPDFVGCMEDVVVNGEWVISRNVPHNGIIKEVVEGCPREPQCKPNPCENGGVCTDQWNDFKCSCQRPYLGHTCQYNMTSATFGHENKSDSVVRVQVNEASRRAIRSIMDISMFIRTRQEKGAIFYVMLGGNADVTVIAAQMEVGELVVRILLNGTVEPYTVGSLKLADGNYHLIQVVRNVTLVQVKINGTEHFRKTISATGYMDVQKLYLGAFPSIAPRGIGQATDINPNTIRCDVNFKGVIQDVQVTNGSRKMVVEFFPLNVTGLQIPPKFGDVEFNKELVLKGVVSDDACISNPCNHGNCSVTWNDFRCECDYGFKGKTCQEMEFCKSFSCPDRSTCHNLDNGYECIANITLNGQESLRYSFNPAHDMYPIRDSLLNTVSIAYRSRTGGTILHVSSRTNHDTYFAVSVFNDTVTVHWQLESEQLSGINRFQKDLPDGKWTKILIRIQDEEIIGGFDDMGEDSLRMLSSNNFSSSLWNSLVQTGDIVLGTEPSMNFVTVSGSNTVTPLPSYMLESSLMNMSGGHFKGCLGEVRIGNYLLPYFADDKLSMGQFPVNEANFSLQGPHSYSADLGCVLCFNSDCNGKGTCSDAKESYTCACEAGFEGNFCEDNINECLNHECKNNATCVDGIANYTCTCPSGYEGWLCDQDIDECLSNPCQNQGTCINKVAGYECTCAEDFTGTSCQSRKVYTCENQPCRNGATCSDEKNLKTEEDFICTCAKGFVGDRCDSAYCAVNQCQHSGECDRTVPICRCQLGYEGEYCEKETNECASNPCQNGGSCEDLHGSFLCLCDGSGYNGTYCEFDIDECSNDGIHCVHGYCENEPGSYHCNCNYGYCGQLCNRTNPCTDQENPCRNGGECKPDCREEPDYVCKCLSGFHGKNCTLDQTAGASSSAADIAIIVAPIAGIILIVLAIGLSIFISMARKKRATRGTYSPSQQEYCNPRVELDNVMKPPPEERLI